MALRAAFGFLHLFVGVQQQVEGDLLGWLEHGVIRSMG